MAWWDDLARRGDRLAVHSPQEELTYRQLDDRVAGAAASLGCGRKLVLLAAANHPDTLVVYLAALRAGHVVLLAPGPNQRSVDALCARYDPDVVVSCAGGASRIDRWREHSVHELHPDLALLLTTSGSTGAAKLVRLSYRNLESNADAIARYLDIRPSDRAATTLPMHYCYGLSVINSHLLRGAGLLLSDRSVLDRCFWDTFRAEGGTTFAGVPYTFDLLDRVGFESMSIPTLRYVTQAGGRLEAARVRHYAELGRRQGWQLFVMYGQTEATARMAYLPPDLAGTRPQAIGVPIPGGSFEIDDGELVYQGPNVMLGYAERPADLALGRTTHHLRTGDLARRADDGLYELVGRRSRVLKLFGLRLDLDHLERVLAGCGMSALCAGDDEHLVVGITSDHDPDEVRRVLRREVGLPPASIRVCRFEAAPRLDNGKPDYSAVAQAGREAAPPASGCSVRAAFAQVLSCGDVPDGATFVSLGGDSLSYVELSVRLEEVLHGLPPDWHTMPVHRLAALEPTRRRCNRVETGVALRAVAIVLVVGSHAGLFHLLGGAHILLGVAGFNFARLHLSVSERSARSRQIMRSALRIAIPTVVWIGFCHVATRDDFGLANAVLLNNQLGSAAWDERWHFWYVESLIQMMVLGAALLWVPAVHRAERAWPYGFAMALLALALTVRFGLVTVWATDEPLFEPQSVLWVFLIGWVAGRARAVSERLGLTGVIALSVPGFFGDGVREGVVAAGLLLLLWLPSVPVPRPLNRVVAVVAAASLSIYLTHFEVWPPLLRHFSPAVATVASIAVGVAAWMLVRRATDERRARRRRPGVAVAEANAASGRREELVPAL